MVVLVDFGLAMKNPVFGAGSRGYTEVFAPPEAIQLQTLVPESDFYSLGMTMLYMLNGNIKLTKAGKIHKDIPKPFSQFLSILISPKVSDRPSWQTRWTSRDIFQEFQRVRLESFGRAHSIFKPIQGL
jgi:serine/threonine protein kinase